MLKLLIQKFQEIQQSGKPGYHFRGLHLLIILCRKILLEKWNCKERCGVIIPALCEKIYRKRNSRPDESMTSNRAGLRLPGAMNVYSVEEERTAQRPGMTGEGNGPVGTDHAAMPSTAR
jgi:hypothetical protein